MSEANSEITFRSPILGERQRSISTDNILQDSIEEKHFISPNKVEHELLIDSDACTSNIEIVHPGYHDLSCSSSTNENAEITLYLKTGETNSDCENDENLKVGALDRKEILKNIFQSIESDIQINCKSRSFSEEGLNRSEKEDEFNEITRRNLSQRNLHVQHQDNELKQINKIVNRPANLVEDSKLVKMSLPMNPMNIMPSNTQFLNKSRKFLHLITEKSTNIMEKALLPPVMRYNSVQRVGTNSQASKENNDVIESLNDSNETHIFNENQIENFEIDDFLQDEFIKSDLVCIKNSLPDNPLWLKLLKNYAKLKGLNLELSCVSENLQKTVDKLTLDLQMKNSIEGSLKKEYLAANKERESMVMKYAVSEKQLIDAQRAKEYAERRFKEISKDQESLQNKLKQAQGERSRICNILDGKCREVSDFQKEIERLKEEVNIREVKLKWSQNKLKMEMEVQKETQQKLDKALMEINEMKNKCDQVQRETKESIRKFAQSEENKAVSLDQQLKEQQARLILERHVTEDKEMSRVQLQKEVDILNNRQQVLLEENNLLGMKIQSFEEDRVRYENDLSNLKSTSDKGQEEIMKLLEKVSELETLKLQLQQKQQSLLSSEMENKRLEATNEELRFDMDACRQREAQMLEFTQKLTDKNVCIQSEFTAIEGKKKQLESEQGPLRERINELVSRIKSLEENFNQELKKKTEECESLIKLVDENTEQIKNLTQKLEDSQGENMVIRRKQQISLKEMTKELQQCRKKLEAYEIASPSNLLDTALETGSNNSLNTGEVLNGALSQDNDQTLPIVQVNRQVLIDRILKLQKIIFKKSEKLEFLEEHSRTLVEELQKKTKIIQNYILHENFDAMGSNERDGYKAELAKHGGIMASVYNQCVSDNHMTFELSLEMNQKLQVVLEDTLLKNITLKDNIDTLGEEIARLTMHNQQKQGEKI